MNYCLNEFVLGMTLSCESRSTYGRAAQSAIGDSSLKQVSHAGSQDGMAHTTDTLHRQLTTVDASKSTIQSSEDNLVLPKGSFPGIRCSARPLAALGSALAQVARCSHDAPVDIKHMSYAVLTGCLYAAKNENKSFCADTERTAIVTEGMLIQRVKRWERLRLSLDK
jgi:hypothetical protein